MPPLFFHLDKYNGVFKKNIYIRDEYNTGIQFFWASSVNKEFITTDLKEGGTYIVIIDAKIGYWKAHVGLNPIGVNNKELFERVRELISEKGLVITSKAKIEAINKKFRTLSLKN